MRSLTVRMTHCRWLLLLTSRIAYLVEVFPYHVRAKGIAVFQWFGRMAAFFNQFVNPIGLANAGTFLVLRDPCTNLTIYKAGSTISGEIVITI